MYFINFINAVKVQQYCPKPIHGLEFQQFFATLPLTVSALVH